MKNRIISLILLLIFSLATFIIPAHALEINHNITGVYGNRAVIIGKAEEYSNKIISVLLLKGDGVNATINDILYVANVVADSTGYYELKIKYDGFEITDGIVSNCTLKVKAEDQDITDTVISAVVNKTDMLAVDIETSLLEDSARAIAKINNLYGQELDSTIMIAAYDDDNKLIGVAKSDKLISAETDEISVTYENMPEKFSRLVAFVWDTTSSLIPYADKKDVDYANNDITSLVMHPGSDETARRFVWYNSNLTYGAKLQYALKSDYDKDGGFTAENSVEVTGTTEVPHKNPDNVSCKVDISNLGLGKEYVYRVGNKYKYDETVYSFKTYNPDNSDKQTFIMVADLHNNSYDITSSNEVKSDKTYYSFYQKRFAEILERHPDVQFIASAGDNVSQANMSKFEYGEGYRQHAELETEVLFAPDVYKKVPWVSVLGNHESDNSGVEFGSVTRWHYNLPNDNGLTGTYFSAATGNGEPTTNGNFWFRNGDVLVVGINATKFETDVFKYSQPDDNEAYIKSAIDANPDAKWRILINHVPSYSFTGSFAEQAALRQHFAKMDIDKYDFDVVFTGHNHSYSRTKQLLTDDETAYKTFTDSKGISIDYIKPQVVSEDKIVRSKDVNGKRYDVATDPEGTVHINVPSLRIAATGGAVSPDFEDFTEIMGTATNLQTSGCWLSTNDSIAAENRPAFTKNMTDTEWLATDATSSYVAVTIEKTSEGQEMKFELIATKTGEIFDTYIIKKTK